MIMGVPYDAEVEYLELAAGYVDGVWKCSYIDTGITTNPLTDSFDIRAMIKSGATSYSSFCGCQDFSLTNSYYTIQTAASAGSIRFIQPVCGPVDVAAGTWFDAQVANGGVTIASTHFTPTFSAGEYRGHFALFVRIDETGKVMSVVDSRIASFDYYRSGEKIQSLIPVRVGSGANAVGYMYDRVTRKLFGTVEPVAFKIGPDVARPVMGLNLFKG